MITCYSLLTISPSLPSLPSFSPSVTLFFPLLFYSIFVIAFLFLSPPPDTPLQLPPPPPPLTPPPPPSLSLCLSVWQDI